ncbi:MAG: penicillin-insensitive murein endopeptidase [Beijerinckiaceae bacterium]|jgi:penicillin-insensitive murein DD-endopeptidase|nr:penicillin-insensitive murein endopeptidase [Beijerinckiaceae bacterium]
MRRLALFISVLFGIAIIGQTSFAQTAGTLRPRALAPLTNPDDPSTPAKQLFGRARSAAPMSPQAVGFYSKGCLAGGKSIAMDGDSWQVMRPSRNRNWGHPALVKIVKRIAKRGQQEGHWQGLLIGDMSQPRGGPMLTGHASHQIGLDADIWFTPMPDHKQSIREREFKSATNMVRQDKRDVDMKVWTAGHMNIVRIAAQQPEVQRILVNAAIKKALCRYRGNDRAWLSKVRPYWGHNYHFHVRIFCPKGSPGCRRQAPVAQGDGCGKALDWWFTERVLNPPPRTKPVRKRPPMTMAAMPAQCRTILHAR